MNRKKEKIFSVVGRIGVSAGSAFFVYFCIVVCLLSLGLFVLYRAYVRVESERNEAEVQLSYWEDILRNEQYYPDAFYNAAYYAARLGEKHQAIKYIESSLYLDKDFEEAKSLREEILRM